jgi:hypothetical protein
MQELLRVVWSPYLVGPKPTQENKHSYNREI